MPQSWLAGSHKPGFALDLLRKDLAAALDSGRALGVPMPASALAYQLYTATSGEGRGRDDYTSVATFYERGAGVHVRKTFRAGLTTMLFGAIDVGTNSIHLIVVELDAAFDTSRVVYKAREMVRLGSDDALERGQLSRKAMDRGVEAIARFAEAARARGAERIRAVATSAVRETRERRRVPPHGRGPDRRCGSRSSTATRKPA